MATNNKIFTEGFYVGQKDLGSPSRHQFRDESPEKHISKEKFKSYPMKTKSLIQRQTSSVAWEEVSNALLLK